MDKILQNFEIFFNLNAIKIEPELDPNTNSSKSTMLSADSIVIACSVFPLLFKTILVFSSFITIFAFVAWTVMKDRKKRGRSSQ